MKPRSGAAVAVGGLLVILALVQLGLLVALTRPIDWGWQVLGALGTVYGLAQVVAIGAVIAVVPVRHEGRVGVATFVAVSAALVGAFCWASLQGGPLLLEQDEVPRILLLIAADGFFAIWLIVLARDSGRCVAPRIDVLAALVGCRVLLELTGLCLWLFPSDSSPRPSGSSSGAAFLLPGLLVLSAYLLMPCWEIAVARWLVRHPG